jgi:hypothetical protein
MFNLKLRTNRRNKTGSEKFIALFHVSVCVHDLRMNLASVSLNVIDLFSRKMSQTTFLAFLAKDVYRIVMLRLEFSQETKNLLLIPFLKSWIYF